MDDFNAKDFIFSTGQFAPTKDIPNLAEHARQRVVSLGSDYVRTRGGLLVPPSALPRPKPTHFDAFCGCGGFGLGITAAGFRTVGAFDIDIYASITYMVNLCSYPCKIIVETEELQEELEKALLKHAKRDKSGEIVEWDGTRTGTGYISHHPEMEGCPVFILGDVRHMTGEFLLNTIGLKKGELDCMTGGPPCQGFSFAGRRNVADPRNNLVYEFGRLICEMQPKTIIFENVPGILSMTDMDGVGVVDRFCFMLEQGGWGTADAVKKMLTGNPKDKMVIKTAKKIDHIDTDDDEEKVVKSKKEPKKVDRQISFIPEEP